MKSYQKIGTTALALAILSGASIAFAQVVMPASTSTAVTGNSLGTAIPYPALGATPAPMVLDVDSSGSALIRGTVIGVGADSITLEAWGGPWTIRTGVGSVVIPSGAGGVTDPSAISLGDFVGVEGALATDQAYTINASLVRDWTSNPYPSAIGSMMATTSAAVEATSTSDTGTVQASTTGVTTEGTIGTTGSIQGTGTTSPLIVPPDTSPSSYRAGEAGLTSSTSIMGAGASGQATTNY